MHQLNHLGILSGSAYEVAISCAVFGGLPTSQALCGMVILYIYNKDEEEE